MQPARASPSTTTSSDKGVGTHHAPGRLAAYGDAARERRPTTCASATSSARAGRSTATACASSAPRPDFDLRVTPSEINAGAGTSAVITAHAIRTDGFAGDIALSLKGAPPGSR